ncbi:hypothetical protein Tco_1418756 [Tanacetum coccineum]
MKVLGFLDSSTSGNPTSSLDPILSTSSPSLTPFEGGDFILEEIEACLTNDSIPPGIDDADFDSEGDLLLLEKTTPNLFKIVTDHVIKNDVFTARSHLISSLGASVMRPIGDPPGARLTDRKHTAKKDNEIPVSLGRRP